MKRLPWILIVAMFIEIGLDVVGVVNGFIKPDEGTLPPSLFRLVPAVVFTIFAFKRRSWALISMAVMQGLTALGCLIIAIIFFCLKADLRLAATLCLATGVAISWITYLFIRTAVRWRRADAA